MPDVSTIRRTGDHRDRRVFFIGGGSLLAKAVTHAKAAGIDPVLVSCANGDPALPKLKRMGVEIKVSNDPNIDLIADFRCCTDATVFSINNKYVLRDDLLSSGPAFFNIHSGLVQKYRGIAEICVFAAICCSESEYGVTLHRISPGQGVDCGPVVDQCAFPVDRRHARFFEVMATCLSACDEIFRKNLVSIVAGSHREKDVTPSTAAYRYRDVPRICATAPEAILRRASALGAYGAFFPKLSLALDHCQKRD